MSLENIKKSIFENKNQSDSIFIT